MMRRGLTMVELLLSLTLLTGIMLTAGSWMRLAGQTGSRIAGPLRWQHATQAVLGLLHDDLVAGDIVPERRYIKVQLRPTGLLIETRIDGIGTVKHEYRLDPITKRLARVERAGSHLQERPLVGQVERFDRQLDPDGTELHITLTSASGASTSRSYRLRWPSEP